MKNNRILLSENTASIEEFTAYETLKIQNGTTLLTILDKMGLTFQQVDDWNDVIEALTKDYPKATILFNVQAAGLEDQYKDAEMFYIKNRNSMRFDPLTDEEIEAIKEKSRVYAESPEQIEAHGLFQTVVDSLTRLAELGIRIEADELYQVSRVFTGGTRHTPLQINPREQKTVLMKLK